MQNFWSGGNKLIIGDNVRLDSCIFDFNGNNNTISLGSNSYFKNVEFYIEDDLNTIMTGKKCSFFGYAPIACCEGTNITFGDDVLMSNDVVFRTSDSHSIIDISGDRINQAKDIIVGNHVWIGNRAIVLKGSIIPNNTIVASAAVVTARKYEMNTIITGNPASVIKENVDWKAQRL